MIPAMNRLSLPGATKQTLHHTSRKQVHSWFCCWPAYQHSSLYSASLCPGGHLHLAWPESAQGWLQGRGGILAEACFFAWLGIRAGFSRNPLFFPEIYLSGLSLSVSETSWCWKWERQFRLLNLQLRCQIPLFWHLVILNFPWLFFFFDIPLHHVYVIAALMFTHMHIHTYTAHAHMLTETNTLTVTSSRVFYKVVDSSSITQ